MKHTSEEKRKNLHFYPIPSRKKLWARSRWFPRNWCVRSVKTSFVTLSSPRAVETASVMNVSAGSSEGHKILKPIGPNWQRLLFILNIHNFIQLQCLKSVFKKSRFLGRTGWPRLEQAPTRNMRYNSLLWMCTLNPLWYGIVKQAP